MYKVIITILAEGIPSIAWGNFEAIPRIAWGNFEAIQIFQKNNR